MSGPSAASGLFQSLRGLLATALGMTQVRLELFGTELETEKMRLLNALWRVGLGLLLLGVAVVLGAAFVLMLFWDGYRLAALGVMVLLFLGGGVALLLGAREALRAGDGGPFALSLGELQRDLNGLEAALLPAQAQAHAQAQDQGRPRASPQGAPTPPVPPAARPQGGP